MAKFTPEQRQRIGESVRAARAKRTPEERHAAGVKGYLTRQKNRGIKPPGRLAASRWSLDDEVDDAS